MGHTHVSIQETTKPQVFFHAGRLPPGNGIGTNRALSSPVECPTPGLENGSESEKPRFF